MTKLLASAFSMIAEAARKGVRSSKKPTSGVILLVDEADALAQSRETDQMHHEDRAGVNALIRGIDDIASNRLPALVVMCTNRLGAIDPAIRRRAAEVFEFTRPSYPQRLAVLEDRLRDIHFNVCEIEHLAQATGGNSNRSYGFTYSDLIQRLLPAIVLDAFPSQPIRYERALAITKMMVPSPPFRDQFDK